MSITGNNALQVNPILVPVYVYAPGGVSSTQYKTRLISEVSEDDAWTSVVSSFNAATWVDASGKAIYFYNTLAYALGEYQAGIAATRSKLTVDLTSYDSDDYILAQLVMKPSTNSTADVYYNEQDWIQDEYNEAKNMMDELGNIWISDDYYASDYTPSRPSVGHGNGYVLQNLPYYQGIYVALIPRP